MSKTNDEVLAVIMAAVASMNDEIIAVIPAAVASYAAKSGHKVFVRSIKSLLQKAPIWNEVGRNGKA
jgi:hypothetical protein